MEYLEIWALIHSDGPLWHKVYIACLAAAGDILNEDPGTANHAARLEWAQAVFRAPGAKAAELKYRILENATIAAAGHDATDEDVQFAVNSLIDIFAAGV